MDCIICLENDTKKKFVLSPSFEALEKLLKRSRERASYKDSIVTSFVERTTDKTAKELYESKVCYYHESCYSNLAYVGKLERAKKRYADSINSGESSVIKRMAGRPSLNILKEPAVEPLTTRSNSKLYDRSCFIICQNPDEKDDLTRVGTCFQSSNLMQRSYHQLGKPSARKYFVHTTRRFNGSHLTSPSPSLPDPEDYGWKWDSKNSLYEAIMTTLPPAPETIIHLTVCQCKTTCITNRCKCRKSGLKCSEMCQCQD